MTTPAKLVNASADLKKYEEMDVDQLLAQLSPEEIQILAKEVDPDVSIFPRLVLRELPRIKLIIFHCLLLKASAVKNSSNSYLATSTLLFIGSTSALPPIVSVLNS